MYITNNPHVARIAEANGVDRIFVDLETIGKQERQGGLDTVQSHHTLEDIAIIRTVFNGELLVRSNPIHNDSPYEIRKIIENGADIVMLPYFKTVDEVEKFVKFVDGKAKVNLLVETAEAVEVLDDILKLDGINEIHIGLNDLHLSYHKKFMFELLIDGTVENISRKVLAKGIKLGIGGIASVGQGKLPAEYIIKEHYRIGSTCAILSRAFCNTDQLLDNLEIERQFKEGMSKIRSLEKEIQSNEQCDFFENNRIELANKINEIIYQ